MFVGDVFRVLARRWFIFGVGLLATGYLGWWVVHHVGTDYQASGQLVFLLPPEAAGVGTPSNPYLNLPHDLNTVAALAAGHVMGHDGVLGLSERGFTAEFDVALAPGTGPLLVITTKAKDPAMAMETRNAVLAEITQKVADMQSGLGIPEGRIITVQEANLSSQAQVLPGSRLRALAGSVGAAVLTLLLLVFSLDRAVSLRPGGRPQRGGSYGGPNDPSPGPTDSVTDHADPTSDGSHFPALAG